MKRFVVIGLEKFGSWVARALFDQGFDVIALERDEMLVDRFTDRVTRCVVADGTDPEVPRKVGAAEADVAVVSTGDDLAATILSTLALREVGVDRIFAKVASVQAMKRFDIDELIFPEREAAERLASRLTSTTVLDRVRLGEGYSIQEMAIPDAWIGKSLRELGLPIEKGVQVVALHDLLTGSWTVVPDPNAPLKESDVAIVPGDDDTLRRLTHDAEQGRPHS